MAGLDGTKVRLRPPEPAEFHRIFDWYSDPELVSPYDRYFTDTYDSFLRGLHESATDPTSLAPRYVVEPLAGGGAVGVVGHYLAHPVLETIEVWYLIGDPSARGHGYGKEAVGLLVDRLFETTAIERVGITCDVENVASIRLAEGLGFLREGTLRRAFFHHSRWHDAYQYGVTRAARARPAPTG